jgi:hypothetical protein
MYLIMESTLRIRYGSATNSTPLVDFLKGLQFTSARSDDRYLSKHFSEKMMKKHHKRKVIVANASTQFSMYKLLEVWATEASRECPDLLEHVTVYCAACAVTDVFRNVKHRRLDTASARAELPNLIATWQQLHKLKYGQRYYRPKFFWLWPIALGLDKSTWLFDMFYVERQHKRRRIHDLEEQPGRAQGARPLQWHGGVRCRSPHLRRSFVKCRRHHRAQPLRSHRVRDRVLPA